jgi:trehalose 6-phosphate synthase/phosphatase
MNIVSYRGPSAPGGVSGTLSNIFDKYATVKESWWHLSGNELIVISKSRRRERTCVISSSIVEGHYRYCNNFLWPILHDMPEHSAFDERDRSAFIEFNMALACNIYRASRNSARGRYFIHDYQLSLLASYLSCYSATQMTVFWHVPWPSKIREEHIPFLSEIAKGLLSSQRLGFHTKEYAVNFCRFVKLHVPGYFVSEDADCILHLEEAVEMTAAGATAVLVRPLGVDVEHWKSLTVSKESISSLHGVGANERVILSVDRADYTKGVLERLRGIDLFFRKNPEWLRKVTFLQICQRTRPGLEAFDRYWQQCLQAVEVINSQWRSDNWLPIVWVADSLSSAELANLYSQAAVFCVNPKRDGLNLTTKEFIACSALNSLLLLSPHAGAWHELGDHVLSIDPYCEEQMSDRFLAALTAPEQKRRMHAVALKARVNQNSLEAWWNHLTNLGPEEQVANKPIVSQRLVHR